jgi:SM-20-related protein
MTSAEPPVELDARLDRALIKRAFAAAGRVHIPGIFTPSCADRVYHCLAEETPWQLHMNDGHKHFDAADQQLELMPAADRVLLLDTVYRNASSRFQCIYNSFPIYDAFHQGRRLELYLMQVYRFLNAAPFLEFAREVTGIASIAMTDAQATLFRPGHFLTQHDDTDAGKRRVAAYVLSFTRDWRPDWGGVLQFIDRDGHVAEGYTPGFNALNLFRVPQAHCVSFVAPFAKSGRYSISGWLREA